MSPAEAQAHRAELEAVLRLGEGLGLRQGLPYVRHWSAAPDFLALLVAHLRRERPAVIVECGSGLSTLILARVCALEGRGRVWSLEHAPDFAAYTREALDRYGLARVASVLDAPLRRYRLDAEAYDWYDMSGLPEQAIELLVVDGPPGRLAPLARYPALPLLRARLAPGCTIFLDDADRPDERACVARWCAEHPDLTLKRPATVRGCAVLRCPS
ncbi:MAG: class I SAM-dependent methyltransferase [Thiobacillaceae bacterium]